MKESAENLRKTIEKTATELGAAAFGVADIDVLKEQDATIPDGVSGKFSRAVVFGIRLQTGVLDQIADRPTPLYFHHYRQINNRLDHAASVLADKIQDAGFSALPIPASQITCWNPMRAYVSHKTLGWGAGLGFIGRSTLLVGPKWGAQLRYASVLTDMPLEADSPRAGECGTCRKCVEACPAQAIKERAEDFDIEACRRKLTEFTRIPGVSQHICGVCVRACPGKG